MTDNILQKEYDERIEAVNNKRKKAGLYLLPPIQASLKELKEQEEKISQYEEESKRLFVDILIYKNNIKDGFLCCISKEGKMFLPLPRIKKVVEGDAFPYFYRACQNAIKNINITQCYFTDCQGKILTAYESFTTYYEIKTFMC